MLTLKTFAYTRENYYFLQDVILAGMSEKKCDMNCDACKASVACADLLRLNKFVQEKINKYV